MACFCHKLSQFHICSPQQRPIHTQPTPQTPQTPQPSHPRRAVAPNPHPKYPKHLTHTRKPATIPRKPPRNPIQTLHTTPASYVLVTHYVITNATQVN